MKKFQVIEDNGGGLTLVVFGDDGNVEYLHSDYEYVKGQLSEDLKALRSGDNPIKDWDGNVDNPQGMYDDYESYEYGWEIVADNDGLYTEKMGNAAMLEFGVAE